jgi:hypothetical protein
VSLYLAIFDGDEEVKGWVFGHYSDFGYFRDVVGIEMRKGCPTLLNHSDCDGEWTLQQLPALRAELEAIGRRFRQLPPAEPVDAFEHTSKDRRGAATLYECFHNVDGENVIDALIALCDEGIRRRLPILFQ